MDGKKQFRFPNSSVWQIIGFSFAMIVIGLFVFMLQLDYFQQIRTVSAAYCAKCRSNQQQIYKLMCEFSGEEGFELPPDWTVVDLIQAAVRKDFQEQIQTVQPRTGESAAEMGHRLEKEYLCRSVHYERKFPYLRRKRTEVVRQYLVFPAPASAVLDGSLPEPVPILMCPPGAHGDKRGSNVLYSDGSVRRLTAEEAEELVRKCHSEPINLP